MPVQKPGLYLNPESDAAQLHEMVDLVKSQPVVVVACHWSKPVTISRPVLCERHQTSSDLPLHHDPAVESPKLNVHIRVDTQSTICTSARFLLQNLHIYHSENSVTFCVLLIFLYESLYLVQQRRRRLVDDDDDNNDNFNLTCNLVSKLSSINIYVAAKLYVKTIIIVWHTSYRKSRLLLYLKWTKIQTSASPIGISTNTGVQLKSCTTPTRPLFECVYSLLKSIKIGGVECRCVWKLAILGQYLVDHCWMLTRGHHLDDRLLYIAYCTRDDDEDDDDCVKVQ